MDNLGVMGGGGNINISVPAHIQKRVTFEPLSTPKNPKILLKSDTIAKYYHTYVIYCYY